MSIGERIINLRQKKGISQAQLASYMDISRQAVSKWENDLSAPDTLNLIRLADILNTNVEYLATGRTSTAQIITITKPQEQFIEKPVIVEKIVEVERIVEVEKFVDHFIEKPVIRKVVRTKYVRNPLEYIVAVLIGLLGGLFLGILI